MKAYIDSVIRLRNALEKIAKDDRADMYGSMIVDPRAAEIAGSIVQVYDASLDAQVRSGDADACAAAAGMLMRAASDIPEHEWLPVALDQELSDAYTICKYFLLEKTGLS